MSKLKKWLSEHDLDQYSKVFAENDIDIDILSEITDSDLKDLGVSLGHRRKLLKLIAGDAHLGSDRATLLASSTPFGGLPHSNSEAEKRFMTLMFCDLADSTRIAAALDVEDMHELNTTYQKTCAKIIQHHGGYVAKFMGDGILAYFGYPSAKDDDAQRGIQAGLQIVESIESLDQHFDLPDDLSLNVRIGISSGPVVVESIGNSDVRENAVVGEAPNLAARLQSHASANTIVIGADTFRLVINKFALDSLGRKPIKGYAEPIEVWQVLHELFAEEQEATQTQRYLTDIVGRDEELNLLQARWRRSEQGNGQVVLLSGEPGIGKTRLVEAVLDNIGDRANQVRLYCNPSNAQSPLYPFIRRLLREARAQSTDSVKERKAKLLNHVQSTYRLKSSLCQFLINLAFVSEINEDAPRHASDDNLMTLLQQQIIDLILRQSSQKPILFVVEDAHWIDPSSQQVLDVLAEQIQSYPIMLLISYRKEKQFVYPWSHTTNLSLNNLTREHASELIEALAKESGLAPQTLQQISEKSGGIPLFLEEVTKSMMEAQQGQQHNGGAIGSSFSVPDTLQASLLSTLDRLGDSKLLAQAGSVFGTTFSRELLSNICNQPDYIIDPGVEKLIQNQITVRENFGEDYLLRFRHALLRDAAYESLLKKNRVQLHALIAAYLENSSQIEERSIRTQIAHHYEMATLYNKAFHSWREAGEAALQAGAAAEAAELLNQALSLLSKVEDGELDSSTLYRFHMSLGQALSATFGAASQAAKASFDTALDIAKELDNTDFQVDALDHLFGLLFNSGDISGSIYYADQMIEIGQQKDSDLATVSGHQGLGMAYCTLADFSRAKEHLDISLSYADKEIANINCFPSMTLDYSSFVAFFLGEPDRALEHCRLAVDSAEKESDYATATALSNSCFTLMMLGRHTEAREFSQRGMNRAKQRGMNSSFHRARLFNNLANAWLEDNPTYLSEVVEAIDSLYQSKEFIDLTSLIGMTAELQIHHKQWQQAETSLDRALDIVEHTGERFYEAELCRLQAILSEGYDKSKGLDSHSEGLKCALSRALEIAEKQSAKGWCQRILATHS